MMTNICIFVIDMKTNTIRLYSLVLLFTSCENHFLTNLQKVDPRYLLVTGFPRLKPQKEKPQGALDYSKMVFIQWI